MCSLLASWDHHTLWAVVHYSTLRSKSEQAFKDSTFKGLLTHKSLTKRAGNLLAGWHYRVLQHLDNIVGYNDVVTFLWASC